MSFSQVDQDYEVAHVEHIDFLRVDKFACLESSSLLNSLKHIEQFASNSKLVVFCQNNCVSLMFKFFFLEWTTSYQVSPSCSKVFNSACMMVLKWSLHQI